MSTHDQNDTMEVTKQKRILEQIMPLRIIREVEKWPVIYKKNSPEMINPHFKYKVWEEVAKKLFENYTLYSAAEKQTRVTSLMKKWRNLRDTFKRHLKVQKKNRQGHNIKRKEYVYFKHMSFLLPHMAEGVGEGEGEGEGEGPAPPGPLDRPLRRAVRQRSRRRAPQPSSAPPIEHIDEDRHFLLSLLPSFKRMDDDEKLTAKMQILKVIKDVKNNSMALETLETDDTLALADAQLENDAFVLKKEPLTVEVLDYMSPADSGSGDTE